MIARTATLITTLGVAALAAGCGDSKKSDRTVEVAVTDAGCDPAKLSVPAGTTTFRVTNRGADKVHEWEVLDGKKILGEKENLTDGLSASVTLTLKEGTYELLCPGGTKDSHGTLTVTPGG
jgi:iron uptake system component EfeO